MTFTDPQVAAVGYTLAAAQEAGLNARAVDVSTQASAGASFYGRDDAPGTRGCVVDEDAGVVVGATFTGPEVAEWLQAATDRGRRRGAAGAAGPRRARLPHAQRGVALPDAGSSACPAPASGRGRSVGDPQLQRQARGLIGVGAQRVRDALPVRPRVLLAVHGAVAARALP